MRFGKLLAAIIGVPMVLAGLATTVAGGVALAVPDDDGWVSAGPLRMRTEAAGFVGEDLHIDLGDHFNEGRTFVGLEAVPARVEIDSRNGKDIFIGVAATTDARSYLQGVAVDKFRSFDHSPDFVQVEGSASVAPPANQDFWVATNSTGDLNWNLADGDWSLVVVNADGSAGVDVAVTGSARIPFLGAIGAILIALGGIAIVGGSLLTYYGVRAVRKPGDVPSSPPPSQAVAVG